MAEIRVIQVAPGSPALDVSVSGAGTAYNLGYETYTSYMPVPSGPTVLRANVIGSGADVVIAHENFHADRPYTVVLSHGLANMQEHIYTDQESTAGPGTIAFRIVNAVEGIAPLQVYITSANTPDAPALRVSSLQKAGATPYFDLPAGPVYLITAVAGEGSILHPLNSLSVRANSGAVRTFFFGGVARVRSYGVVGFTLVDADTN